MNRYIHTYTTESLKRYSLSNIHYMLCILLVITTHEGCIIIMLISNTFTARLVHDILLTVYSASINW